MEEREGSLEYEHWLGSSLQLFSSRMFQHLQSCAVWKASPLQQQHHKNFFLWSLHFPLALAIVSAVHNQTFWRLSIHACWSLYSFLSQFQSPISLIPTHSKFYLQVLFQGGRGSEGHVDCWLVQSQYMHKAGLSVSGRQSHSLGSPWLLSPPSVLFLPLF